MCLLGFVFDVLVVCYRFDVSGALFLCYFWVWVLRFGCWFWVWLWVWVRLGLVWFCKVCLCFLWVVWFLSCFVFLFVCVLSC